MTQQGSNALAADLQALDKLREWHIASVNHGDAESLATAFAGDGVQLPPNAPANVGREAIRTWASALFAAFRAQFVLSVEEIRVLGDWAFERGTYRMTLIPRAGGEPATERGKYLTLYEKRLGTAWSMARDIWNSDSPLPA